MFLSGIAVKINTYSKYSQKDENLLEESEIDDIRKQAKVIKLGVDSLFEASSFEYLTQIIGLVASYKKEESIETRREIFNEVLNLRLIHKVDDIFVIKFEDAIIKNLITD